MFSPVGIPSNARFRALEIVSTNVQWLKDCEEDIENAFGPRMTTTKTSNKSSKSSSVEFIRKANELLESSEEIRKMKLDLIKPLKKYH